uniref:peptide-methionine (S)-S-oxide reductase n=1 Tax=Syphacia muris TaxID=451379 RepID=A0A0N5AU00_9BILA
MQSLRKAYLGMECFWSESVFAKLDGVVRTRVGYAGGEKPSPSYYDLGDHTETIEVEYDDSLVSFDRILDCFWSHHDPTQKTSRQYQSTIFYVNDEQRKIAEHSFELMQQKRAPLILSTRIVELDQFYQAEDYHQKYWLRCQPAIFRKLNLSDEQLVSSTLAAKVNAFLAGYDNFKVLERLAREYHLDTDLKNSIELIAKRGGDPRACH